jgi:hypothetical protein
VAEGGGVGVEGRARELGALEERAAEGVEAVEVALEAGAQEGVVEHGDEGGREREGDARGVVGVEAVEHGDEGEVALQHGLEEPALLEVVGVLGVAHIGEVRVQDEEDAAEGWAHGGGGCNRDRGRGRVLAAAARAWLLH